MPFASRGSIREARSTPTAWWPAGTAFEPPGYSPPWKPLYVPVPRSLTGVAPMLAAAWLLLPRMTLTATQRTAIVRLIPAAFP